MMPRTSLPDVATWNVVRGEFGVAMPADVRSVWADDAGFSSIFIDEREAAAPTFILTFGDLARFVISFDARSIIISPGDDEVSESTIEHLLVDQVWPRILAHGGELVLHAAGVATPAGAIMFVGQSGHGKSTLAASLHQRGFALLGDDAMVLSVDAGEPRCRAVYRSLRLFPDSITTLFDQPVVQSEVADYTEKLNIHLPPHHDRDDDQPLRALFFLHSGDDRSEICVSEIQPAVACMLMVEHSFWLDPTDLGLTARKLASASALATKVPAYQLDYPRDFAGLADLHAAIFSALD